MQKIVPVKNGNINQIFPTVRDVMQPTGLIVKAYENSVIVSGKPEMVAAAEQLVKNLDAAAGRQRDVEITGYIVLASAEGQGAGALPADLDAVVKQFRNVLNYKSFRVLDTLILRAKEGTQAHSNGLLALPDSHVRPSEVQFSENGASATDDTVHIRQLAIESGDRRISEPTSTSRPDRKSRLENRASTRPATL